MDNSFVLDLIEFHKIFLTDASKSISKLAEIQKKYPEEYSDLVKMQKDPSYLLKLSEKLDDESRKILIDSFIRASTLSTKLMMLYELSYEEKQELIKEIEKFSESMQNSIKLLKKK